MYSHWQASWRSGVGLGVVVVVAVSSFAGPLNGDSNLERMLLGLTFVLGACIYILVVTIAFRVGFRFCGRSLVGLNVVVVTPVIYAVALATIAFSQLQTHAQVAEVVTAHDALIHNVVVPSAVFLLVFFMIPALIAYGTARIVGGRASVA
jgi:hypothetical protein